MRCRKCGLKGEISLIPPVDLIGGSPIEYKTCPECGRSWQVLHFGEVRSELLAVPILLLIIFFMYAIPPWETIWGTLREWFPGLAKGWVLIFPIVPVILSTFLTRLFFGLIGVVFRTQSRGLRVLYAWLIVAVLMSVGIIVMRWYFVYLPPSTGHPRGQLVFKGSAWTPKRFEVKLRLPPQTESRSEDAASGLSCGLGSKWVEQEGDGLSLSSTWVRRGSSNVFDANYDMRTMVVKTVDTVTISSGHVHVERTESSDGNLCVYDGSVGADGKTLTGTYHSLGGGKIYQWRATVVCEGLARNGTQ